MARFRSYFEELTRALLVLALVLLNLAHTPTPVVAHDGFGFTSANAVVCGDGGTDEQGAHVPCHACRIGSDATLPLPPSHHEAVELQAMPVLYQPTVDMSADRLYSTAHRSRGPPQKT